MGRYDVQLMRWGDGSKVPASGKERFILGIDDEGRLCIRGFDAEGGILLNTDETQIVYKDGSQPLPRWMGETLATIKQRVQSLMPPHELTRPEKDELDTLIQSLFEAAWVRYFNRYLTFTQLRKIQSDKSYQGVNIRYLTHCARDKIRDANRPLNFIGRRKKIEEAERQLALIEELSGQLAALPPEQPSAPKPSPSPEPPPQQRPGAPPGQAPKAPYKTKPVFQIRPGGTVRVEVQVDENGRIIGPDEPQDV